MTDRRVETLPEMLRRQERELARLAAQLVTHPHDHAGLGNLTTGDPHTQYALTAGDTFTGRLTTGGFLNLGTPVELTIDSGGAVTVTQTRHTIDTFADAATDNLDTINGGSAEDIIVLSSAASTRNTTIRDTSVSGGNILLAGDTAFTFININDTIAFRNRDSSWFELWRANV